MPWFRIAFDHALTHCVPQSLVAPLVVDMVDRGHPIEDFEKRYGREHAASLGGNPAAIMEWGFDVGGFWVVGQPMEQIVEIDGIAFEIASDHVPDVLHALRKSELRRFVSGESYYKLKLWLHATVLTVEQRDVLLHAMGAIEPEACRRADAFFAAHKRAMQKGLS